MSVSFDVINSYLLSVKLSSFAELLDAVLEAFELTVEFVGFVEVLPLSFLSSVSSPNKSSTVIVSLSSSVLSFVSSNSVGNPSGSIHSVEEFSDVSETFFLVSVSLPGGENYDSR